MNRFKTLLLREWMQHQRGWLVMLALPLGVFVLVAAFGQLHADFGDGTDSGPPGALPVALGTVAALGATTLMLAWSAALLMSPGLARRDTQDRSIEFWLSLPVGHAESLGATLLAHLLLLPWAALAVGLAGGVVVSLVAVAKLFGVGAWFALPWGGLLAALAALGLRLALGIALATLWMAPLVLGTMAASAWLKRWGVPAVAGVLGFGGLLLDRLYGNPVVWDVLRGLSSEASHALIVADRSSARALRIDDPGQVADLLAAFPGWCLSDAGHALAALATPAFAGALLAGLAAFGLLWLRRRRGA